MKNSLREDGRVSFKEREPDLSKEEPYQVNCPLCENEVQVARTSGDICNTCGAELDVFSEETAANQFAEKCKGNGETAQWRPVENGRYWVVAHKASPHQELWRRAG